MVGEATAVAVDSADRVYVFNRGPWAVVVYDRSGAEVGAWGGDEFVQPHGIAIDRHDHLYLVDRGHFVQKRTTEGEVLLTIGTPGSPGSPHSGAPFNRPTDVAVHPGSGDIFVSDGYGNSCVHRFDHQGRHVTSFGGPGSAPGQLCLPHGVAMVGDDTVVVCDRENFRLQFFSLDGEFIEERHAFHPMAVRSDDRGRLYVALGGPPKDLYGLPNLGDRVVVSNAATGEWLSTIGSERPGLGEDQLLSPHGIAVDSHGDVYVAGVPATFSRAVLGQELDRPESLSLRKWRQE